MNPVDDLGSPGPGWLVVGAGVIADMLGILGYLGLSDDHTIRTAVVGVLGFLGVLAALTYLVRGVGFWLSPRGASLRPAAHRSKIAVSTLALLIAVALVVAAIASAANGPAQQALIFSAFR